MSRALIAPRSKLGRLLRMHRERRGLTQAQVAMRLGITQWTYSYWETRRQHLLPNEARRISCIIDCPLKKLTAFIPATKEPKTPLGAFIQSYRIRKNLTRAALAKRLGLNAGSLDDIERGWIRFLHPSKIERYAKVFGVAPAILWPFVFSGTGETSDPLGSFIRRARLRQGWSQAQLAKRIGVSRQRLSAVETGIGRVADSGRLLDNIARALKVPAHDLLALRSGYHVNRVTREPGSLADFLTQLRRHHRWRQIDIARRMNVSLWLINNIERGHIPPSPRFVERCQQIFRYDPATFERLGIAHRISRSPRRH